MNQALILSELGMLKNAMTLGLHRIDTLLMAAEDMPDDGSDLRPYNSGALTVSIGEMLDDMHDVASRLPGFDDTFINSLHTAYAAKGTLSEKQLSSLKNIHRKFHKAKYE
jgi:hypothetical protein